MAKQRGLGRGLDNFIKDTGSKKKEVQEEIREEKGDTLAVMREEKEGGEIHEISLSEIHRNEEQPRKSFNEDSLRELAKSIEEVGILQPLLLRKDRSGYEIIAGERRFRAAQMAGLTTVPALLVELSQEDRDRVALIENIQREDLNPMEEAFAYAQLKEKYLYTQEELSKLLGKSRPYVANSLRMVHLPGEIQDYIAQGKINISQAKVLMGMKDEKRQLKRAREIAGEKVTVREFTRSTKGNEWKYGEALTRQFMDRLGTKATLSGNGAKGKLIIDYYTPEDLLRISDIILGEEEDD